MAGSYAFHAWQVCVARMAGSYAFLAWQLCSVRMAAFRRAAPPERGSAGAQAHPLDRQDRGDDDDDDDDGDDDDYNDKRIMVDDGLPRYTGLTAKQRRMLL